MSPSFRRRRPAGALPTRATRRPGEESPGPVSENRAQTCLQFSGTSHRLVLRGRVAHSGAQPGEESPGPVSENRAQTCLQFSGTSHRLIPRGRVVHGGAQPGEERPALSLKSMHRLVYSFWGHPTGSSPVQT
jgi:hypothetical protein